MFSLTSRNSASLRAALCSQSDDTTGSQVNRYRVPAIGVETRSDDPDRFLTAPGHHIDGAEVQTATNEYAILAFHDHRESNGGGRRSA